jgi:hypothetical protein
LKAPLPHSKSGKTNGKNYASMSHTPKAVPNTTKEVLYPENTRAQSSEATEQINSSEKR